MLSRSSSCCPHPYDKVLQSAETKLHEQRTGGLPESSQMKNFLKNRWLEQGRQRATDSTMTAQAPVLDNGDSLRRQGSNHLKKYTFILITCCVLSYASHNPYFYIFLQSLFFICFSIAGDQCQGLV